MKRNVGKAINIINACSFHPYTGKKALRVKRSNRLYWSHRVAVGSGLALSSIPSVPPHKKVQIYIRSPFIYIFKRNIKFARGSRGGHLSVLFHTLARHRGSQWIFRFICQLLWSISDFFWLMAYDLFTCRQILFFQR